MSRYSIRWIMRYMLVILFFSSSILAFGDTPITFTFQAQISEVYQTTNKDKISIVFSIYSNPIDSIALWKEEHSAILNDGIITVTLGQNEPLLLDFSKDLWLGMNIKGQEIFPRLHITMVPKAIYATVADSLSASFTGIVKSINGLSQQITLSAASPLKLEMKSDTIQFGIDMKGIPMVGDSIISLKRKVEGFELAICNESIGTEQLKDHSITREKLQSGVIPVSLPPEGVAGGNLTGKYPNPQIREGSIEELHLSSTLKQTLGIPSNGINIYSNNHSHQTEQKKVLTTPIDTLLYFQESRASTIPNAPIRAHMFTPKGTDYDIDIVLSPKGMGSFLAALPDDASGGMKRGIQAVDLQLSRMANHQIASGDYASLIGGMNNAASGNHAIVLGGISNNAEGSGASIIGGYNNHAGGTYAFSSGNGNTAVGYASIAMGISNTSAVESSAAIAGKNNYAGAAHAIVLGGNFTHITAPSGCAIGAINSTVQSSQGIIVGGKNNVLGGSQSIILGGNGMTLSHTAVNSIATLANNQTLSRNMTISAPNTFVMGNMDLWLASNDNVAKGVYFFEPGNIQGHYPGNQHYTMLRAGTQQQHIVYTLPLTPPMQSSQVLISSPNGQMSWGHSMQIHKNIYIDCPQLQPAGGTAFCDLRIQGVQSGAVIHISPKNDLPQGVCIASIRVLQSNTVRIAFMNATGRFIDPPPLTSDMLIVQ